MLPALLTLPARRPAHAARRPHRLLAGVAAAATVTTTLGLVLPTAALAQGDATAVHTSIVSADPADFTPAVKDGIVESVVQVGNTIVIGGTFTTLVKANGTTTYTRTGLAAFDATDGTVSTAFNPTVNGEITSMALAADGQSVYIGGAFSTVNGVTRKKVAQVRLSDGSLVTGFKAKGVSATVNDLRLDGGTLWIAGQFKKVNKINRAALASLDATSGALTDRSTLVFAGQHNGGSTNLRELAMTPDHNKLVAIGNFTSVNGQPRDQVAIVDIAGPSATLSGWQTNFFTSSCSNSFDTFMRDVAVSPDGTYAVFATTGAYRANTSCDTISRFDITGSSPGVTPTWINMTGGDTTTAVAIVGSVVYIGGHFRWVNNFSAGDRPGQGAIERTALAALDPASGLPYPWNPTRERGYGVYDFLATDQGLWVGSDTNTVGNEYHPRIAFFPLAGGQAITPNQVGSVPGDVITVGAGASPTDAVTSTQVDGAVTPGSTSAMSTGDSWSNARGAMLVDNTLFTAWSDRKLYASPVNGSAVGTRTLVNDMDGPLDVFGNVVTCTQNTSGSCLGAFSVDIQNASGTQYLTGMFYDSGRVYYTMSGSATLYYRYFQPMGGIVGGTRFTAGTAPALANARGLFMTGGKVYFADNSASGHLYSLPFNGGTVSGSPVLVDGTRDWRGRGLALRGEPPANQAPTAAISVSCTFLACSFSGAGSHDPDGSITSYSWDFGDGDTATGVTPATHTFDAAGTYHVTLSVTDDDGAPDTAANDLAVSEQPASPVAFRDAATTATSGGTSPKVAVPSSAQVGDALVMFVTLNVVTTATPPAGWSQLADTTDGDMVTRVYAKAAEAGDIGSDVAVSLGSGAKSSLTLVAYSGVDPAGITGTGLAEPGSTGGHAAPSVAVGEAGSWVLSYWADKGSSTPAWTVPGSMTQRALVLGSGGGQVGGVTADTAGAVPTGTFAGLTATSSVPSGKATSFSIVLPPA